MSKTYSDEELSAMFRSIWSKLNELDGTIKKFMECYEHDASIVELLNERNKGVPLASLTPSDEEL